MRSFCAHQKGDFLNFAKLTLLLSLVHSWCPLWPVQVKSAFFWDTLYFHVKKISWVCFLHFFQFWPLKCIFYQFTAIFHPLIILAVNWPKMHFKGQNRKKWRKWTPTIFWFYMKICPPTFSGPPRGWENDIFSKNRTCLIWQNIWWYNWCPTVNLP